MIKKAELVAQLEASRAQINTLAAFILSECPGEPSVSEGAVDAAIRIIRKLQTEIHELQTTKPIVVVGAN